MQCPTNEDPNFDVIPNSTYVCMFCENKGEHYRMFCPNNPAKDSVYKRRLAKGLVADTKPPIPDRTSFALRTSPSSRIRNANLVPLGTNSHKRRLRSNSSSPVNYKVRVPARLLREEDEDYIAFERSSSPSPEVKDVRRFHKRIRIDANYAVQNTHNRQEAQRNGVIAPIFDNSKCQILTQLINEPNKIEVNRRPARLTALDMWEVNDIRKLREERYGDEQTIVSFQEDIDRYVQVKEAYEQGGQVWEDALEGLIKDAYENLSVSNEVTILASPEDFMYDHSSLSTP